MTMHIKTQYVFTRNNTQHVFDTKEEAEAAHRKALFEDFIAPYLLHMNGNTTAANCLANAQIITWVLNCWVNGDPEPSLPPRARAAAVNAMLKPVDERGCAYCGAVEGDYHKLGCPALDEQPSGSAS